MASSLSIKRGIYDLLSAIELTTKELGKTHVEPWLSQKMVIDAVADGLEQDVHEFVILKSRQMAITTICSVIELFWCLANPGVQGAIIADRTDNLERLRRIFADLLETLPPAWRSAEHRLTVNNRTGMAFANRSVIDLLAAGSNPDLGASRALNLMHATECSLWKSLSGVESLKASLARENPNRLYCWESIANGFNWFYNHCQQAKQDRHMRFIFVGFWANPTYSIRKSDPDYKIYGPERRKDGVLDLSDDEITRAKYVKQQYNYTVKPEQFAWWRRESVFRADEYMFRHFPFTERECFISSGSSFFPAAKTLDLAESLAAGPPYQGYKYRFSQDGFLSSSIEQTKNRDEVMLKVWEPPVERGTYVIGVDPSGGGGGDANDHSIEVFRCYGDRLVQCAEFCTNSPLTYQLAWVLAHLCGAYREHMCNLEITGIGAAVMPEVRNLRLLAERGILQAGPESSKILNVIGSVRWFLYSRMDSLGGATNIVNWKTNADNKMMIFEQLRSSLDKPNVLELRSINLVKEMQAIVEDEGWIGAGPDTGVNDDLVMATVLAHHAWIKYYRDGMTNNGYTWKSVNEKPPTDPQAIMSHIVSTHIQAINRKASQRKDVF